ADGGGLFKDEQYRLIRSASRVSIRWLRIFEQTTPALRACPSLLRRGMCKTTPPTMIIVPNPHRAWFSEYPCTLIWTVLRVKVGVNDTEKVMELLVFLPAGSEAVRLNSLSNQEGP